MNVERLERLALFLEKEVDKNKFWLATWMRDSAALQTARPEAFETRDILKPAFSEIGEVKFRKKGWSPRQILEPTVCQTVGCAMGWAATIPEFKKAGLKLVSYSGFHGGEIGLAEIYYKGKIGFDAAAKFFEITGVDAGMLFDPACYPASAFTKPRAVSKRIHELIEGSA